MATHTVGMEEESALLSSIRHRRGWNLEPISVHDEEGLEERACDMELEDECSHRAVEWEDGMHNSSGYEFTPSTINSARAPDPQEACINEEEEDAFCCERLVKRRRTECSVQMEDGGMADETWAAMRDAWRLQGISACSQLNSAGDKQKLSAPA